MKKILGILGCTLSAFLLVSFIPSGMDDDPLLPPNPCENNEDACPPGMTCVATIGNASFECLSDTENKVCPNGGYAATGKRHEDNKTYSKLINIQTGATVEIVAGEWAASIPIGCAVERILTTSYNCDSSKPNVCWVCNRYVVF